MYTLAGLKHVCDVVRVVYAVVFAYCKLFVLSAFRDGFSFLWFLFREGLMDTQAVNWCALDALVLDYLDQEQLLEGSKDNQSLDLNGTREIICLIRSLIEAGYIPESLHLLRQHARMVLEDQHLLFRLYKQVCIFFHRSDLC